MQDIVIRKEKNENVKDCIGASACCVPESLKGEKLSEGGIKKIYNGNDLLFWHKSSDSGREVNINEADSITNKSYFCAQLY
jgi:hypothetical protein